MLPCSLSTKENIKSELFDWRSDDQNDVFLYDNGLHYNNGRRGQSEQFKGRVFHFPDEVKHGNASIIIRNTKVADSGVYTCYVPLTEKIEIFYIKLAVVAPQPDINIIDATDDGVLLQCEVRGAALKPRVEWQDRDGNKLPAKDPQVSEREDRYNITLQTIVTKTLSCSCVVTQEETNRRTHAEIYVAIIGFSTGWIVAGVLVPVAGVILAVYIFYRRKRKPKLIKVEEGRGVTLPSLALT
ncbi:selection and upkeep of intraepithelial T-cells protein 7-like [Sander vitreus]